MKSAVTRGWPARARNPVTGLGVLVVTSSALLFVLLFSLELLGYLENPYIGLVTFVALPLLFLAGLLLIPAGIAWTRRRIDRGEPEGALWPRIDLNDPSQRRLVLFMVAATLANVSILSMGAYGGIHYMESVEFCGQVCHAPMEPQFTAYGNGPHARVPCVSCHVGSGAPSFLRSKLNGLRQLTLTMSGRYPRPIPAPVRNLRPATEICERCHWPEKFHGDTIRVVREYANDAAGTETVTTVRLHVGGGSEKLGIATGIHWHMYLAHEIEYIATDDKRQEIPYVQLRPRDERPREYVVDEVSAATLAQGERRRMDCMDCHNRPAHTFEPTPERAVDRAIAVGQLSRELPFARREAVAALSGEYTSRAAALAAIADRLSRFYREQYPDRFPKDDTALRLLVAVTQDLYQENVFPSMGVTWKTYPNELGHIDFPGCFRCHDGNHKAADGSLIRQDCDICHAIE